MDFRSEFRTVLLEHVEAEELSESKFTFVIKTSYAEIADKLIEVCALIDVRCKDRSRCAPHAVVRSMCQSESFESWLPHLLIYSFKSEIKKSEDPSRSKEIKVNRLYRYGQDECVKMLPMLYKEQVTILECSPSRISFQVLVNVLNPRFEKLVEMFDLLNEYTMCHSMGPFFSNLDSHFGTEVNPITIADGKTDIFSLKAETIFEACEYSTHIQYSFLRALVTQKTSNTVDAFLLYVALGRYKAFNLFDDFNMVEVRKFLRDKLILKDVVNHVLLRRKLLLTKSAMSFYRLRSRVMNMLPALSDPEDILTRYDAINDMCEIRRIADVLKTIATERGSARTDMGIAFEKRRNELLSKICAFSKSVYSAFPDLFLEVDYCSSKMAPEPVPRSVD